MKFTLPVLKIEVMSSIDGVWISTGIAPILQPINHYGLFYLIFTLHVLKIEVMFSIDGVWISTGIASML